ncbi:hypothetical protein GGR56DRAFT_619727 [Xylariaceae sp. FL0804]|nr:hypothetical protein GGR56DRAFT_619727 [Xylariaceae sp. FL0804]
METAVERYAATATATGAAAACDFLTSSPPSMPAAVQSQYRSYDADVSSWYAARSGDMSAVAATCTAGDDDYASVFVARITQIVELVESFTATGCTATGTGSSGMASSTGAAAHSSTMTSSGGAAAATSTGSGKGSSDADSSSTKVDTGAAARPTALTAGFAAAAGVLAAAIML